jgi:hypothetical protein
MMFLSEQRRIKLVSDLTGMTMPVHMARRFSSYSDDMRTLDSQLSATVIRIEHFCTGLTEAAFQENVRRRGVLTLFLGLILSSGVRMRLNSATGRCRILCCRRHTRP